MERHRRDLEGEARQHEHQAEQQARAHARLHRDGHTGEAGRARKAIEQRNAVEQDARRQRAQHEIFETRFGRTIIAAQEARQNIGGQALQLETDIERQQVDRRHHRAHAHRRQQDEHRILGPHLAFAVEEARGDQDRDRSTDIDQDLGKGREGIGDIEPLIADAAGARGPEQRQPRGGQQQDAQPADRLGRLIAAPGRDEHQRGGAEREDDLRNGERKGSEIAHDLNVPRQERPTRPTRW